MGMTERDKKVLAIVGVIVLLGGFWFLVIGKKRTEVAEAQTGRDAAQQRLTAAIANEQAGKSAKKAYPVSYSRVLRMGKAIPVDADFASLLVQINDVSDDAKVNFVSLSVADAAAAPAGAGGGATAGTTAAGATTCDAGTGATGATGASAPAGPSPAQSAVGSQVNNANAGAAAGSADAARAAGAKAEDCAAAPTLTDIAALSAGLRKKAYNFTFTGNFFNLNEVFEGLLKMVKVQNGRVKVTGRLLDISTMDIKIKSFPTLEATVVMTGYVLPTGSTVTAGSSETTPIMSTVPPPAATVTGGN
ncbi:MAG: hypothetical protein ACSLFF_11210 [Solirubrobacterales bacterium]